MNYAKINEAAQNYPGGHDQVFKSNRKKPRRKLR